MNCMKTKPLILFFIGFLLLSFSSSAQEVVLEGKQVKKSQNVQYVGETVYVAQKSMIEIVEGSKTSFSLRIDNFSKYQFYFTEGKYEPPTYSVIIEPGMYQLYPDLPPDTDSVFVKIKLVPIDE